MKCSWEGQKGHRFMDILGSLKKKTKKQQTKKRKTTSKPTCEDFVSMHLWASGKQGIIMHEQFLLTDHAASCTRLNILGDENAVGILNQGWRCGRKLFVSPTPQTKTSREGCKSLQRSTKVIQSPSKLACVEENCMANWAYWKEHAFDSWFSPSTSLLLMCFEPCPPSG